MESAEDATATIDELIVLHDANVTIISKLGRAAKNAILVFNYLESLKLQLTIKKLTILIHWNFIGAAELPQETCAARRTRKSA